MGSMRQAQPARSTWKIALKISRIDHSRGRPVLAGGGMNGERISHSASDRSLP